MYVCIYTVHNLNCIKTSYIQVMFSHTYINKYMHTGKLLTANVCLPQRCPSHNLKADNHKHTYIHTCIHACFPHISPSHNVALITIYMHACMHTFHRGALAIISSWSPYKHTYIHTSLPQRRSVITRSR